MNFKFPVLFSLTFIVVNLFITIYNPLIKICEREQCPICYGTDFCDFITNNKLYLKYSTISDVLFNLISVKNVFKGSFNGTEIIMKKLGHSRELVALGDSRTISINAILKLLQRHDAHFFSCNTKTSQMLIQRFLNASLTLEELWTISSINVEPLLLRIFKQEDGWPVPKYLGACGRIIIEDYCGEPLTKFEKYDWFDRSQIAVGVLEAAFNFSDGDDSFRLYLTDVSPDNIVVDENLKVYFVDLESGILTLKSKGNFIHYSEDFDNEYSFSVNDVCKASFSDHNIYAVCKLILSKFAPWPMMEGGLLHDPPLKILEEHGELFINIEHCVYSSKNQNRFFFGQTILKHLKQLLLKYRSVII